MYNATEQFAEFNKTNVAQATKFAALSLENAEKLVKFNLAATKAAIAQSVEGAQAVSTVKDVQDLLALRTKLAEAQVQHAILASSVRNRHGSASRHPALAEEVFAVYTKAWRRGSTRPASRHPRLGRRDQRVQVDDRRDRRVRPVPEGFQASREPGDANVRRAAATAREDRQGRRAA
jgi:hypothetical protein